MAKPVLFLIEHLTHGGTEIHLRDLVMQLGRNRFEPHVIYFYKGLIAEQLKAQRDIRVTHIPVLRANDLSALRGTWLVRRYLQRHRISALITYHFLADLVGTAAAWGLSRPVVISSRRDMGFTRNRRQLQMGALLDRRVDHYIAVSNAVRDAVSSDERIHPAKISTIYNGCDIDVLDRLRWDPAAERKKLGIDPDEVVVGCVANFNPVKGHLNLIDGFARLAAGQPRRRVRLLLAGDGPQRQAIEDLIDRRNLGDRVILQGYSKDVSREFLISDIVVLASETEGFSNTIVQAMLYGKPIVATHVGGNPEAIREGESGFLVPPRDPEALAHALGTLLSQPELARRMGEEGRRRAEQEFSIGRMMERTEALILETIKRRCPGH